MEGELTLTYFDLYGLGESIRMLLAHSKTPFKDNRVSGETWAAFKTSGKCANGQVPVLEVGDKCLNQSTSILRFIGSQKGYYGPCPFEQHFADAVIETMADLSKADPKDSEGKPLLYQLFGEAPLPAEHIKLMCEARNKFWAAIGTLLGDRKYFGGNSPSIADFKLIATLYSLERNTKGNKNQAHVYEAHAEAFAKNTAQLLAWADLMAVELKDYLETRSSGSL